MPQTRGLPAPGSRALTSTLMNFDDPWFPEPDAKNAETYNAILREEAEDVVLPILVAYDTGRLVDRAGHPGMLALRRIMQRMDATGDLTNDRAGTAPARSPLTRMVARVIAAGRVLIGRPASATSQADLELVREMLEELQPEPCLQDRIGYWLESCLGNEVWEDTDDRAVRFIEEAVELIQALGIPAAAAHRVVDYVYSRERGEVPQEIAGVLLTLANVATTYHYDMIGLAETELERVWKKIDKVRAKQAGKPDLMSNPEEEVIA